MPIKTIKEFKVDYLQVLDKDGICDEKLKPKLSYVRIVFIIIALFGRNVNSS